MIVTIELAAEDVPMRGELERWFRPVGLLSGAKNQRVPSAIAEDDATPMGDGALLGIDFDDIAKFCEALKAFLKNARRPPTKLVVIHDESSISFETGQLIDVDNTIRQVFQLLEKPKTGEN